MRGYTVFPAFVCSLIINIMMKMLPETRKSLFLLVLGSGSLEFVGVGAVKGRKIAVVAWSRDEEAVLLFWASALGCPECLGLCPPHELDAFCIEPTLLVEQIICIEKSIQDPGPTGVGFSSSPFLRLSMMIYLVFLNFDEGYFP